jgi:preprotein translocase subunit SecA
VNKALEKAQSKVEARNFDIRKNILQYDDVMNDQRKVIYEQRKELMAAEEVHDTVVDMRHQVIDDMVARFVPEKAYPEQWEIDSLHEECRRILGLDLPVHDWAREEGIADAEIRERITKASDRLMAEKAANFGPELMRHVEKQIVLNTIDRKWREHLLSLDHLRHGIGLRAFAQRNPLNEYKQEAFELFQTMLAGVREDITFILAHVQIQAQTPEGAVPRDERPRQVQESREDPAMAGASAEAAAGAEAELVGAGAPTGPEPASGGAAQQKPQPVRHAASAEFDQNDPETWGKVGRNQPCPCGSGRKFKHCHGKLQ